MTGGVSSWGAGWFKALEKPSSQVHNPVISGANSLASNTKALEEPSYAPYNPSQPKGMSSGLGPNKKGTQKPSNELHKHNLVAAQVSPQQHARKVENGASTSVNPPRRASESVQSAYNTPSPSEVQRAPKYPGQNPNQGRSLGHQMPRQGDPFQAPQTPRLQDASGPSMPVQRMNPAEPVPRQTAYGSKKGGQQPLESSKPFQTPVKQRTASFTKGSSQLTGPAAKRQPTSGGIVEYREESARAPIMQPTSLITRKPEASKNNTHNPSQPSSMVTSQRRDTHTAPSQREANNVKQTTVPHESKLHHLKDLTEKKIAREFQHLKDGLKPNHNGGAAAPSNNRSPRRASPPQSVAGGAIPGGQAKGQGTGKPNFARAPPIPVAKSAPAPKQHEDMREGNVSKPAVALGAGTRNAPSQPPLPQARRKDEHGARPLRLANAPGPTTRNTEKSPSAPQSKPKPSAAQPTQGAKLGQNPPKDTKAPATGPDARTKSANLLKDQSKSRGVEQKAANLGSKDSKSEAKAPQARSFERPQRESWHGGTDVSKSQNKKPKELVQKSDEHAKSQNAKPKESGHADKSHQGEAKPHPEKPKPKERSTGSSSKAESNRPRALSVTSVSGRSERGPARDCEEDEDDSKRLSRSPSRESARSGETSGRDLSDGSGDGGEEPRYDEWEDGARTDEDAKMDISGYDQRETDELAWMEQPDFANNMNLYQDAPRVDYDGNDYPPFDNGGESSGIEDRGLGDDGEPRYEEEQEDKDTGNADEWNYNAGDDTLNDDMEGAGMDDETRRLGLELNENETENAYPEYNNDVERKDRFNDDYRDPETRSYENNSDLKDRDDADYPEPESQSIEDYPGFDNQSNEMPEQEEMYSNDQGIDDYENSYGTQDYQGQDFRGQAFEGEDDAQYQQLYEDQGAAGGFENGEEPFDEFRGEFEAAEETFKNEVEQIEEDLEQNREYEEQQREDEEQEIEDVEQEREDAEQ